MKRFWKVTLLATILLLLSGCSEFVDPDQVSLQSENSVVLDPDHPVGQTFVARHGGLSGVEVWLEPNGGGEGEIVLHLRSEPGAEGDLVTTSLPLAQVDQAGFYRFSFHPLRDSHGRYYYAFLEMEGEGSLLVGAGGGGAYLDGALYRSHEPLNAQMGFRLAYDPRWMLLDLGWAVIKGLGLLAVAGLLYVVPGWALLTWLWPDSRLPWPGRLGIAVGLSLALYPLLFLWTDLVGLHLGPLYAWLPVGGGLVALIWRHRDWRPRRGWEALRRWARSKVLWPDLVLLVLLGLIFGVRLLVVRTLDAPMWGDSYQHTMIAQLLVDNGGLFDSWEPYADLQTFTYHFGFHTTIAGFHWLTGLEMHQAVLWGAQVLNGLAVLVLYPLAMRVSKNRWAGVGAVLVAGLLSPMPMYYVNWGRYTQLAGQAILPAAVVISWSALEARRRDWRLIGLSWIAVGGLALTHYRVLIFYVFFVLVWALLRLRRSWRRVVPRVVAVGLGAGLLFLPWFVHIFAGRIMLIFGRQLTTLPAQTASVSRDFGAIRDPAFYMDPILWLLFMAAGGVGLWHRRRGALMISLWWFILLIVTNPTWVYLPGSKIIRNHTLFMAMYIPAGLLMGCLLGWLIDWVGRRWMWGIVMVLLTGALGLQGMRTRMGDVRIRQHAMVTRPDRRAMAWIRENTPEDARFLINSFFAYGGGVVVGSDGGWWIPLLAERANTIPPLNYGMEGGPYPGYRDWINDLTRQIQEVGPEDAETLRVLWDHGVTHVYVGQQWGRVNYDGPGILNPEALLNSAYYEPVYHQDRVWVFEVTFLD